MNQRDLPRIGFFFLLIGFVGISLLISPARLQAEESLNAEEPFNAEEAFNAEAFDREKTSSIGIAVFNMAWAGTISDFKRHVEVCGAPEVNWCESRAKIPRGADRPSAEEEARAKQCQKDFISAAGGPGAAGMIAPCSAYGRRKHPAAAETVENYNLKLDGLRATIENLIRSHGVQVIAFQEVRSQEVIQHVLGKFSGQFDVCVAPHTAFQTVAFAWDKSILSGQHKCAPNQDLAIAEHEGESAHRVRPGLALELTINDSPVTFLNIHLKSGCANLNNWGHWPGHRLTDPEPACAVLNRQIPILEDWIEQIASHSPRFVLLGDFNRRIDEEARARIARTRVRTDGSDPATANIKDASGAVKSSYLWQEIADGSPQIYQVRLKSAKPGCKGLPGLDHIVVSGPIKRAQGGPLSSRKIALTRKSRQPIATSDHCPTIVNVEL